MEQKRENLKKKAEEAADEILSDPESRKEVLKRVSGRVKLLADPYLYAQGAVECIENQLKTVKSPKRKMKLESKLKSWKETLSVLENEVE